MTATVDALCLRDLEVRLRNGPAIVSEVSLTVRRGEILGIVGESGSGKTTTALALLGHCAAGVEITSGSLTVDGQTMPLGAGMHGRRGGGIAYIPQNPGRALNPSLRVADLIGDLVRHHHGSSSTATIAGLLRAVGLEGGGDIPGRYPHQLSGGQQQRVCIAMALACDPSIVVLDEPTTGLDVSTQDQILRELVRLRAELGVSMVYVTHDLAVVSGISDRLAVMYAGRVVEQGPTAEVLGRPRHPYTRGLILSTPDHLRPRPVTAIRGLQPAPDERPQGCGFAPRCDSRVSDCHAALPPLEPVDDHHDVRCIRWRETKPVDLHVPSAVKQGIRATTPELPVLEVRLLSASHDSRRERVVVAHDISFQIGRAACVALVGESGSGKTTIARAIAGLHPPAAGEMLLHGDALPGRAQARSVAQRRQIQLIFQNSTDALNPRHTIHDAVARPARLLRGLRGSGLTSEVDRLLELVRLPRRIGGAYPAEISGGERQRVAIARALAAGPELLLCDEITSALDVSVQAAVLEVLGDLRRELGLSLLFITHDLGVVATLAESVIVLERGRICERGTTNVVLRAPTHPYTQTLLADAPSLAGHSRAALYT